MIRKSIKKIKSLSKWLEDPFTNGKIRKPPIRGTQQPIAKTKESVVLIPIWRAVKGTKDFVLGELAGRAAHAINVIIGTGRDYGRGGYKYRQAALKWSGRVLKRASSSLFHGGEILAKTALKVLTKALEAAGKAIRNLKTGTSKIIAWIEFTGCHRNVSKSRCDCL